MTTLEHDLERWEAGELSSDELRRLHPDAKVVSLVDLYTRLSTLGNQPVGFSEERWESLRDRLPDRPAQRSAAIRRLVTRPLVAAVAAVTMTGAVAYAASPAVRHGVSHAWHDVFGSADQNHAHATGQGAGRSQTEGHGQTGDSLSPGGGRGDTGETSQDQQGGTQEQSQDADQQGKDELGSGQDGDESPVRDLDGQGEGRGNRRRGQGGEDN